MQKNENQTCLDYGSPIPDNTRDLPDNTQYFAGNPDPQKKYLSRCHGVWIPRKGRGKGEGG